MGTPLGKVTILLLLGIYNFLNGLSTSSRVHLIHSPNSNQNSKQVLTIVPPCELFNGSPSSSRKEDIFFSTAHKTLKDLTTALLSSLSYYSHNSCWTLLQTSLTTGSPCCLSPPTLHSGPSSRHLANFHLPSGSHFRYWLLVEGAPKSFSLMFSPTPTLKPDEILLTCSYPFNCVFCAILYHLLTRSCRW